MTHIENIDHILKFGITHKNSQNNNPVYYSIGDSSLISTRNSFTLENGLKLGDYIPFYFGLRTPMLYVIQKGYNGVSLTSPEEIVYCVTNLHRLISSSIDFIYCDGHATDGFTNFYSAKDISKVEEQIDFEATNARYWNNENDLDFKRRKEAELLIANDLPPEHVIGFITYKESAKTKLLEKGVDENMVVVKPNYYF